MAAHRDRGTCRWSGEKILEKVADNSGLSGADGAQRDYSSRL
jgi:hypothetical protein